MLESVFVYGLLTLVMVVCGSVAARREPEYVENSGLFVKNDRFVEPEIAVIIAAFTFVFGCRYGVGVDYFRYLFSYQYGMNERYEFLFRSVSNLMLAHNLHYSIYFSFWAFLQIVLLLYAFRNYRFIFPYLLLYIIIGNYFMSMVNIIRQQLAALIFLCSIQFIDEKKIVNYLICIFLASMFHRSALLMVVMYPILRYRDDWFQNVGLQLILLFAAVFLSFRFDLVTQFIGKPFAWFASTFGFERYRVAVLGNETLDDTSRFGANTGMGIFVSLFKCLPIILLSKPLKMFYHSSFFNMLYSMWFVRVFTNYALGTSVILNRPFVFFTDIGLVMLSFFTYYCFKSKKSGLLLLGTAMIAVNLIMFLFVVSNGKVTTTEYTFFWQH